MSSQGLSFRLVEIEFQSKLAKVKWFCIHVTNIGNSHHPASHRPRNGLAR